MDSAKSQLQTTSIGPEISQPHELPFNLILEERVSIAWLQDLFRWAFVTCEIDKDGDLYLTDGLEFPIWITVLEDQKTIRFFTFLRRDPAYGTITEEDTNHLNMTVLLPTFHVREEEPDKLYSAYAMTYTCGVIDAHVIAAARRFSGASLYGAQSLDAGAVH